MARSGPANLFSEVDLFLTKSFLREIVMAPIPWLHNFQTTCQKMLSAALFSPFSCDVDFFVSY